MKFTVTWNPQAEAELAQIWLQPLDRNAVTNAAADIERILTFNPQEQGEDYYGDRILIAGPLAVVYTVSEPDRIVQVVQVLHG